MPGVEQNSTRGTESNLRYIGEWTQRRSATGGTNLTNRQDIIYIQALKQWPHRKVDVHQSSAKVQPTGEPCNNFETCLSSVALGGSIQTDDFTRSRSREREDLGDLESMRLNVLGESCPRESEVVPHKVIDWVSRHQSYSERSAPKCTLYAAQTHSKRRATRRRNPLEGTRYSRRGCGRC